MTRRPAAAALDSSWSPWQSRRMKPSFLLLPFAAFGVLAACSSSSTSSGSAGSCADVAGDYTIVETFSGTCPSTAPVNGSLTVSVTGSDAKLTNGTDFLVHCTLSGCDCTTKTGDVFKFSGSGFTASDVASGCTPTTTATKGASTPGGDAGGGGPDPATDGGGDAKASTSRTSLGESCEKADLPTASSSCAVPGTYEVTESLCSSPNPACTDVTTTSPFTWTAAVTVIGSSVKLTNGTDRLEKCTLTSPCTCTSTGGFEIRFTQTGFVGLGASSCQGGAADQNVLTKGVKQ